MKENLLSEEKKTLPEGILRCGRKVAGKSRAFSTPRADKGLLDTAGRVAPVHTIAQHDVVLVLLETEGENGGVSGELRAVHAPECSTTGSPIAHGLTIFR
jgi:hypothetical protein